jgi:hypothetical protein
MKIKIKTWEDCLHVNILIMSRQTNTDYKPSEDLIESWKKIWDIQKIDNPDKISEYDTETGFLT